MHKPAKQPQRPPAQQAHIEEAEYAVLDATRARMDADALATR